MKLPIFGSTGGTGRELVSQALEQGHEVQEQIIRESSLDWMFVRPAVLTNGPRRRVY